MLRRCGVRKRHGYSVRSLIKPIFSLPFFGKNTEWGFDGKEEFQFLNACSILNKCIENNFELQWKKGYWSLYVQ